MLLFERFSNHCLANTVEPLRAANDVLGRSAYEWCTLTPDGAPVASSSHLSVVPAAALDEGDAGDALVVMPSYGYRGHTTPALRTALARAAERHATLIGLDTGAWPLAAAGLLEGRRATIHPSELDAFAERFPRVHAVRERTVEDGKRITAGGATAAFDVMLGLITRRHGAALGLEIEAMFLRRDAPLPSRGACACGARSPAWRRAWSPAAHRRHRGRGGLESAAARDGVPDELRGGAEHGLPSVAPGGRAPPRRGGRDERGRDRAALGLRGRERLHARVSARVRAGAALPVPNVTLAPRERGASRCVGPAAYIHQPR